MTETTETPAPAGDTTPAPATGAEATPAAVPPSEAAAAPAEATGTEAKANPDAPEATGAPETYADFTMPEGVTLDAKAIEQYAPVFKELGLTQEQAQRLVDLRAAEMKAMADGSGETAEKWYAERRAAEIAEANVKGIEAIKADAEIGGEKFEAVKSRVIEAVGSIGTVELRAEFDRLGLGNNPEIVRFVNRLIDYTPQDHGERAAGAGRVKSREERWYPNG